MTESCALSRIKDERTAGSGFGDPKKEEAPNGLLFRTAPPIPYNLFALVI